MPSSTSAFARACTRLVAVSLALVIAAPVVGSARPVAPLLTQAASTATTAPVAAGVVGPLAVSLEASSAAVASDGTAGYTVHVHLDKPASFLQVRLKLYRPTGRLIYQRTRIANDVAAGEESFSFERDLSGLDLKPGVYPVEVEVRVVSDGETSTGVIDSGLLVFDAERKPVKTVFAAKVSPPLMSGPDGVFVTDPAQATRARDDVDALSTWALQDPEARVTLAVSPMVLEEWKRVSGGYRVLTPAGPTDVPPGDAAAAAYAATLERLAAAMQSGRLELTSLGYSDPDLSALERAGLGDDTTDQYATGTSASFTALETTTSTGTVPAGGALPPASVAALGKQGVSYAVVDSRFARAGETTAKPGTWRVADSELVVLVAPPEAGRAASSADASAGVAIAFGAQQAKAQTLVFSALLDETGADGASFVSFARELSRRPFVNPVLGREAAASPGKTAVTLTNGAGDGAPKDYWPATASARSWAKALGAALPDGTAQVESSERNSLVAEGFAWSGPAGSWQRAQAGLSFATAAEKASRQILDKVSVTVREITLSGTHGEVPVTISNGTEFTLNVILRFKPSRGLKLENGGAQELTLRPQENYVEVPVELQNVVASTLEVSVMAGDTVLDTASVQIRGSYLDRLAIIFGIIVALALLLFFIIRRVRTAAGADDAVDDASE